MKLSSKALFTTISISVLSFATLLTGCVTTATSHSKTLTAQDLQTPRWSLVDIDGEDLNLAQHKKSPSLSVDEQMMATGRAGCNNYFGEAQLKGTQFRIFNLSSTMKLCLKNEMEVDNVVTSTLSDWSELEIDKGTLTLTTAKHVLTFNAKRK
jgi:heat shock protein HslJ